MSFFPCVDFYKSEVRSSCEENFSCSGVTTKEEIENLGEEVEINGSRSGAWGRVRVNFNSLLSQKEKSNSA